MYNAIYNLFNNSHALDPLSVLPLEISNNIFSHLENPIDLLNSRLVSSQWHQVANDKHLWKAMHQKIPESAFGPKQWFELLGIDVGEAPPLPLNINEILKSRCPFSDDENIHIEDTHWLVLIPKTMNGIPLTLKTLGEFGQTGHRDICPPFFMEQDKPLDKSRWVLMTKGVIPESRNKSILIQNKLIESRGHQKYQIPSALEAATCLFIDNARSKIDPTNITYFQKTFTNCQENKIVVGKSADDTFLVTDHYFCEYDWETLGAAALRRLEGKAFWESISAS